MSDTKMVELKFILSISVAVLLISSSVSAVEYTFTNTAENTPGGIRYNNEIGRDYSLQILETASAFTWNIFQQHPPDRKNSVERVSLFVEDIDGIAYTSGDQIHVSARAVQDDTGDVRTGITGVLYHEVAHVWQWDGNRQAPGGLIEGVADFVRLKSGFAASHWVGPGQGDRWDQGYDVTARFLDYCNDLGNGNFVAQLNEKMRDGYNNGFFEELLGKNVDALWADYKAAYGN